MHEASANASAAQPATKHLPLSQLNAASGRSGGTWDVAVYCPFADKYEYKWQNKPRQGVNFVCTLVCADDPSQYCQAHFKKTTANASKHAQTMETFKNGQRFVMSRVGFVSDAKAAYVSAPLKDVVDLSKTTMDRLLQMPDSAVQPVPKPTVAGSSDLGTNQFFDVTARVHEVGEIRAHENNRSSFLVNIVDGSLDKDVAKIKVMPLRIYCDTVATHSPCSAAQTPWISVATGGCDQLKKFLEEQVQNNTAVSFYCISGAQDDQGKYAFRTTKSTFLATATGPKAEKLNTDSVLHSLRAEDTVSFELQAARAARDWSQEQGKETSCKLLASFARTATGIAELDSGETIWQLNWVVPTEPSQAQNLKGNDGTRLWFPLAIRDISGPIVLYITEQAALKLTGVVDAAEFDQLHADNRLRFPVLASVKVWRKPSKASAEQPASTQCSTDQSAHDNAFDCYIVDAAPQNKEEAPSVPSTRLLPMLGNSVDNVLPARLDMVRKSEHYAMAVQYITQEVPAELIKIASKTAAGVSMSRPCARGLALVLSTKRSEPFDAGGGGHKLVTKDVVDYLSAGSNATQKKYTLTSFCTLQTVTDFKLDPPPRGKNQAALITFTGVLNTDADSAEQPVTSLLVDNVQQLQPEEAEALMPVLNKMIYFAALAGQVSRKRDNEPWTADESPAKALTCRVLGRSPTGPALPDYMPEP